MNKRPMKTAFFFSVMVFVIVGVTMSLTVLFTMCLYRIGAFRTPRLEVPAIVSIVVSIAIGTLLSIFAGQRPIAKIVEISEATKQVAKGNFDVRLDENIPVTELQEMAHSFNIMIKELAGTEMLRSDFIENVSHEFKTPLTAIEGYVTLLQKKGLSEEKRMEYTGKILFNTKRLSTLTGNILLLSQLENQQIEVRKEKFSLDEQLREVVLLFEPRWSAKNLDLDIDLDSEDFYGNSELLAQVWQNVIGNAMKFVSDNGRISVLLRRENAGIRVSVTDDGPGMSKKVAQRVFEKFYQGDPSRSSSGNGLGLALAKRIVDLHGGTIEVASEEGRGTTFTVTLPVE